jgi:hypothetical protein
MRTGPAGAHPAGSSESRDRDLVPFRSRSDEMSNFSERLSSINRSQNVAETSLFFPRCDEKDFVIKSDLIFGISTNQICAWAFWNSESVAFHDGSSKRFIQKQVTHIHLDVENGNEKQIIHPERNQPGVKCCERNPM